ncbi:MAG: signal peptidase I [Clostridia bacterium]
MENHKKEIIGENSKSLLHTIKIEVADSPIVKMRHEQVLQQEKELRYTNKRKQKFKKAILSCVIWSIIICIIPFLVFFSMTIFSPASQPNFFGIRLYVVTSQSMEPQIMTGDCILVKSVNNVKDISVGSDITFTRASDKLVVTHRVAEIINDNGLIKYKTYGINNKIGDSIDYDKELVEFNNVIGTRIGVSAFLGDLLSFGQSAYGIVALVMLVILMAGLVFINYKISNSIRHGKTK